MVFVDTNILIYAHDRVAGSKCSASSAALEQLWRDRTGVISVQVLQEFYVNVTRKLASPLAGFVAREILSAYATWIRSPTTAETVLRASHIMELAKISFWDALIVAAAEEAGADTIYTEDLQAGQSILGISIVNPLR